MEYGPWDEVVQTIKARGLKFVVLPPLAPASRVHRVYSRFTAGSLLRILSAHACHIRPLGEEIFIHHAQISIAIYRLPQEDSSVIYQERFDPATYSYYSMEPSVTE